MTQSLPSVSSASFGGTENIIVVWRGEIKWERAALPGMMDQFEKSFQELEDALSCVSMDSGSSPDSPKKRRMKNRRIFGLQDRVC
jgi:hypothetical protein